MNNRYWTYICECGRVIREDNIHKKDLIQCERCGSDDWIVRIQD